MVTTNDEYLVSRMDITGNLSGMIAKLATTIGASEAALRLLLTILAGYPIVALYRTIIVRIQSPSIHHLFFASCGLYLCYFNYGKDTYHSVISVLVTFMLMLAFHEVPHILVPVNFIFHMSYLLVGYYFTESNDYDIIWTMPHCVLALRMIGFGFDLSDGKRRREELSKDQCETMLEYLPSLLELFAYVYFPFSFLVGPQFPLRRYQRFIDGEFRQHGGELEAGIKRMLLGVLYLGIRQIGATMLPESYFLTEDYSNAPFILRLLWLGLWGKFSLYKYISCWLLTEGALMCIGFSYAGKTPDGKPDWSGCTNVKLILLETGNTMGHYVQSFNVNTNNWVAQYIYKRLKFLNNRMISYAAALGFLAVWHGFHTGYYMAFLIEYMIVTTERQIEGVYNKEIIPKYGHIINDSLIYKYLLIFALKSYNLVYMGWCLTPFIFLSYERWIAVFSAVNYFGYVYCAIWFIIYQIYKKLKKQQQEQQITGGNKKTTASSNSDVQEVKKDK